MKIGNIGKFVVSIVIVPIIVITMVMTVKAEKPANLLVSENFTLVKIDGKPNMVNSGNTATVPAGKHIVMFYYTLEFPPTSEVRKTAFRNEIEFDFESGKKYKFDISPDCDVVVERSDQKEEIEKFKKFLIISEIK